MPDRERPRWSALRRPAGRIAAAVLGLSFCASLASASSESGSLLATPDEKFLISANFDAGSISKLDAQSGERRAELALGANIERIALSSDGRLLLASDPRRGRVLLVDVEDFALRKSIDTGGWPFGIVYDAKRERFWVALFEAGELAAIDRRGRVVRRVSTLETPRGLALLDDGRLLVSHALLGKVSILDVAQDPPVLLRTIALRATRDPDPFVSQGVPRLLDDIAVSPDGREAWLPHVLWSFDHPFQFRSTVFPAISVLELARGAEREREDARKQLFRQINVVDGSSKARIVSNPHDAAFSADGSRVYVTLSASEDLAVFDRGREALAGGERRSRRKGKQSKGGAQAVQILRHLPGDNPRGLVALGDALFVQNAMSLDVCRLASGGAGPFARVSVSAESFARLVARDPLPPRLRRGKRLFYTGNTSEPETHPMAGDFWMSCASCHVDGFNFTNRHLMRDARASAGSGVGTAASGHRGLRTMVAGDFVGDYIRMVQDTQGGMGADERAKLPRVNPDRPPREVASMMRDLHDFVTAPENLPYLSTWLRVGAAPERVAEVDWTNPARCAECHADIFAQWSTSNHRLMSSSHPYYRVLEDLAAAEECEAFRSWCMGCHDPKRLAAGLARGSDPLRLWEKDASSLRDAAARAEPHLDEGTDCLFCHRVSKVDHAGGNASLTVDLEARETYPFEQSTSGFLRGFGERLIAARPVVHARSYSSQAYADPRYCGSCHAEFAPGSGADISDTYAEWEASPFNAPGEPKQHRTCADCHMHADVERIGEPLPGRSTDGGRVKPNVRTHRFTGANLDFVALRDPESARQSRALLERAAELEVGLADGALQVRVRNVGAGHSLPTGVADLRQLWIYVRATDARGKPVVESGELGPDGDPAPDARIFHKILGDAEGQPVGLRFWRYATLLRDTRIPAGGFRDETFPLPADVAFPLRVDAELRFRTFPRWVTLRVRERLPDVPVPQVHVLRRVRRELRGGTP